MTTHWLPNLSAASVRSAGRSTAAVLMLTLSAPACSSLRASSTCGRHANCEGRETSPATWRTISTVWRGPRRWRRCRERPARPRPLRCTGGPERPGRRRLAGPQNGFLDDATVLDVEARDDALTSIGFVTLSDRQGACEVHRPVVQRPAEYHTGQSGAPDCRTSSRLAAPPAAMTERPEVRATSTAAATLMPVPCRRV